ncbi:MAG: hypothetical protein J0I12_26715 [Candidatus Eremiobacteraeota bacterium]|nr:hypothetical protein [Candidatus Eremiobacteraeota bacterium]
MDYVIKFGCPIAFTEPWQVWAFLALPCLFAALGARVFQGSFLRIIGATLGAALRDGVLMVLVANGMLTPTNGRYDLHAAALLILCVSSGGALGAVFGPYRGLLLMITAALGALAGQFAYGFLPLVLVFALALHVKARQRHCALPTA